MVHRKLVVAAGVEHCGVKMNTKLCTIRDVRRGVLWNCDCGLTAMFSRSRSMKTDRSVRRLELRKNCPGKQIVSP